MKFVHFYDFFAGKSIQRPILKTYTFWENEQVYAPAPAYTVLRS